MKPAGNSTVPPSPTDETKALCASVDELELNAIANRHVNDLIREGATFEPDEVGPYIVDLLVQRAETLAAAAQEQLTPIVQRAIESAMEAANE